MEASSLSPPSPRVLLCPPEHFGVEYVINPWMVGHVGRVDRGLAQAQWDELRDVIDPYARVELLQPVPHLPDLCFVANAGVVLGDAAVLARFRVRERGHEEPVFAQWLSERGFQVRRVPDDASFEGEGDALFQPDEPLLWAGYGVRSSLGAHVALSAELGCEVISLRLTDPRFYHLDTCFCPLPDGRAMYHPGAFDTASLARIHDRVPPDRRLEVGAEDALGFACNAVRLGSEIVLPHASPQLTEELARWGYSVHVVRLTELMKAGGAAKCLCLFLDQAVTPPERDAFVPSSVATSRVELSGDLLDAGLFKRALDSITDAGGSCRVAQLSAGLRADQPSVAHLLVSAPDGAALERVLAEIAPHGATMLAPPSDARLEPVAAAGVAPEDFCATTIYPTDVRVGGRWVRVSGQRMDGVVVIDPSKPSARCALIRDLLEGELVVTGVEGIRVLAPESDDAARFSFMSAGVSSERRVERVVEELAFEMRRIRGRGGRIVLVAGPVVVHTGGAAHVAGLVRAGYVQALLAGNALPVHDIELALFGTSLGVDLGRGVGVPDGHQHHLRAINRIRAAGSIRAAVAAGILRSGILYECVQHGVDVVLAGSIRDDGPLPDTIMDLVEAQAAYQRAIQGAELIVMLGTMLHSIGTGNMTPAGVKLICVDINPAVVTKLADRGSLESVGVVTDVGLFLHLLAGRLV